MDAKDDTKTLPDLIAGLLRVTPGMRAADLVKTLAETGAPTSREAVNKALYHGPFESAKADGKAAPLWSLRPAAPAAVTPGHFRFEVDGVGAVTLADAVSEADVEALLTLLATMVVADRAKLVRHDSTASGKMVARVAPKLGFAVEATPL